jgi:hypothetical protein
VSTFRKNNNRPLVLNYILALLVMPAGTKRPSAGAKRLGEHGEQKCNEQNEAIDNLAKFIHDFLAF